MEHQAHQRQAGGHQGPLLIGIISRIRFAGTCIHASQDTAPFPSSSQQALAVGNSGQDTSQEVEFLPAHAIDEEFPDKRDVFRKHAFEQ